MKKALVILFLAILLPAAYSQRERNYIYLFDCTQSMKGYGGAPNIWDETKKYLKEDIEAQGGNSSIVIVPFQDVPYKEISFAKEDFDWQTVEKKFDAYVQKITHTNICDTWDKGMTLIDKNKDNYVFLLTDGLDNKKGMSALCNKIRSWCGKYKNTHAFYVMLTKNAMDPNLVAAVNECDNIDVVDGSGHIKPFGSFDSKVLVTNTNELNREIGAKFSAMGTFKCKVSCTDPNIDVRILGDEIKDGIAKFKLKSKVSDLHNSLGTAEYDLRIRVSSDDVKILNPELNIKVINKEERILSVLDDKSSYIEDEVKLDGGVYYPSFLFCGESGQGKISVSDKVKFEFNDAARKVGAEVVVKIEEKNKDGVAKRNSFVLYVGDSKCDDGSVRLRANESIPEMYIVFDKDAEDGKHYMEVKFFPKNIDKINNAEPSEFAMTLRSRYDVEWNPLKLGLVIAGLILLALLVIWFVLMKRMLYPTFKSSIRVTDPYYYSPDLRGAKKVVLCAQAPKNQGFLNKLFTGRIDYSVSPVWTSPLELTPMGDGIRAMCGKSYVVEPYATKLTKPNEYEITNTETNEKITIQIY